MLSINNETYMTLPKNLNRHDRDDLRETMLEGGYQFIKVRELPYEYQQKIRKTCPNLFLGRYSQILFKKDDILFVMSQEKEMYEAAKILMSLNN
jgi:hypothetical protein